MTNHNTAELNTQEAHFHFLDQDEILMVHRTLARAIGLNAAIVLRQVHYWVSINAKARSKRNYHDGCYWTFNSIRRWTENDFPFWSTDTVERAFSELTALRLIYTAEYNKRSGDRTKWYTVNYGAYAAFMRLWADHNYPPHRPHRDADKVSRSAFIEDWAAQSTLYAALSNCQTSRFGAPDTPHYRNLPPPLPQLAPTVTKDYPETTKDHMSPDGDAGSTTQDSTAKPVTITRNALFDIIAARSFNLPAGTAISKAAGGRIGKAVSAVKALDVTADDMDAFYRWYAQRYPNTDAPRDGGKLAEHVLAWRAAQPKAAAAAASWDERYEAAQRERAAFNARLAAQNWQTGGAE